MREDNYNEHEDVKMITNQLWKSISILRGVLPVEQHHIYLFLLSAYYDDIIEREVIEREVNYEGLFYVLEDDYRYSELLNIYRPIINSLPEWTLKDIIEGLVIINKDIPEFIFNKVFDNLLCKLSSNQGKDSGNFLLPNTVISLFMK